MRNNIVLRWTLSAVVILLIVMGSYLGYASIAGPTTVEHEDHGKSSNSAGPEEKQNDEHGGHGEHRYDNTSSESDVIPTVHYEDDTIHIELKDKAGNAVDGEELEVNHEKIMHLIIVSDEQKQYFHLHPEKKGKGAFTVQHNLSEGSYKAFIDIKPKDKNYEVKPLPIKVGAGETHGEHVSLKPDTEFTKTVDDYTVTMTPETFKSNEEIVLDFDLKEIKPEPYLGALGHVVILDESGDKYVHVHPASETDTRFATKFGKPGIYKIWAEFKMNGKVHVFPFVVDVK